MIFSSSISHMEAIPSAQYWLQDRERCGESACYMGLGGADCCCISVI